MWIDEKQIRLEITGIGIVFYSPSSAAHIKQGEDYLSSEYTSEHQVQTHIQKGSLVGFGTGSPGVFVLRFHSGYPTDDALERCEFTLRLGLQCVGGEVCFRDLYDLMDWNPNCPQTQILELEDGVYHVTLCSHLPPSGTLGDNQVIDVYLNKLDQFPLLTNEGIPTLCT